METQVHVFEAAGVGIAPYTFVTVLSLPPTSLAEANTGAYNDAMGEVTGAAKHSGFPSASANSVELRWYTTAFSGMPKESTLWSDLIAYCAREMQD